MLYAFDYTYDKGTSLKDKVTYLQSVDHHQSFSNKSYDELKNVLIKCKISLEDYNTREQGILLLRILLQQGSCEIFFDNAVTWLQLMIKCLQHVETSNHKVMSCSVLRQIIEKLLPHPVLQKEVRENLLRPLITALLKASPDDKWIKEATLCLGAVMQVFTISCAHYIGPIKKFLLHQLDSLLVKDVEPAAVCYAFLPLCYSGSQNFSTNWSLQLKNMLRSLNSLFSSLNDDGMEAPEDPLFCKAMIPPDTEEPYSVMLHQVRRFQAVTRCVAKMLCTEYNSPVKVPFQALLSIACKTLNISYEILVARNTPDSFVFASFLSEVQSTMIAILESCLLCYPHYFLARGDMVMQIILQMLKATTAKDGNGIRFRYLRCNVLKLFRVIIDLFKSHTPVREFAPSIIPHLMKDIAITPTCVPVTLISQKSQKSDRISTLTADLDQKLVSNYTTCSEALRALTDLTTKASGAVSPEQFKSLKDNVVGIIRNVQQSPLSPPYPYDDDQIRFQLYSLMLSITMNWKSDASPLTHSLEIFKNGVMDSSTEVSGFCLNASNICCTIIFPTHVCARKAKRPSIKLPTSNANHEIAECGIQRNKTVPTFQANGILIVDEDKQLMNNDQNLEVHSGNDNAVAIPTASTYDNAVVIPTTGTYDNAVVIPTASTYDNAVVIPTASTYDERGDCNDENMPSQEENSDAASVEDVADEEVGEEYSEEVGEEGEAAVVEEEEEEEEVDDEEEDAIADADGAMSSNTNTVPKTYAHERSDSTTREEGLLLQQSENELQLQSTESEMDNLVGPQLVRENGICESESDDGIVYQSVQTGVRGNIRIKRELPSPSDDECEEPPVNSHKKRAIMSDDEEDSKDVDAMMNDFMPYSPDEDHLCS